MHTLRRRPRALRQPLALRVCGRATAFACAASERSIRLLHPLGHNYYHMLREKLHWSETL